MSLERKTMALFFVLLLAHACIAETITTPVSIGVNILTHSSKDSTASMFPVSTSPSYEARGTTDMPRNNTPLTSQAEAGDVDRLATTTHWVQTTNNQNTSGVDNDGGDKMSEKMWSFWTFRAGHGMFRVYPLLLLAIGSVGNILALTVFIQPRMIKFPTYIYLTTIAVFDTVVLLTNALTAIGEVYNSSIISNFFCKFISYLNSTSIHISVWLVVSVTVERAVAIGLPLKAAHISTRKNAVIVIAVVIIAFALLNMHLFWTMMMPEGLVPPRCKADVVQYESFLKAWPWIDASLFAFVPCILLFVLNITVIVLMKRANERMRNLTNQQQGSGTRHVQSTQVTVMLLIVSFFFLICVTPSAVLFLYRYVYWEYRFRSYPNEYARFVLVRQILLFLFLCNNSFNFLLYAASGKRFREEFARIFCSCCKKPWFIRMRENVRLRSKQSMTTTSGSLHTILSKTSSATSVKPAEIETNFETKSNKAF